ncbi:nickel-dependent hydrogenase large subunit [Geomesophilobacter sediminis]|uniref:Nickel-dependent hydrogenase large subunit n=1 Tax=Geomesophilobacter sediminis TaxID=2798584 RepID=A0A8J7M356_9BACT|nr:nickel-dependent hydrogenase large subunit [Geomesophilobacter sediminis]MBJ6727850.1 nickel-dependent hydrogenase large subunit [Geomesophilobacter sediminis]
MTRIVVDPITRIEGHLRIEAEVNGGRVSDAWSSSTMFRGIETILKGRDPRDAWYFTQRFCGVCTTVHSIASIRCVENALDIKVPPNAQLIRNIIMGIQNVQDHVIHFYHLHALDWVDITSALKADPTKTAALAASISDWPLNSPTYFKGVQDKLKAFVAKGRLGPFANAYWGHPAYKLPPEANLMATAHYLEALEWQKDVIKVHAILGSKNPHPQTFLVGGMAIPIDLDSQNALNADKLAQIKQLLAKAQVFVEKVYIPDLIAVASFYKEWGGIGGGVGNYLSYGEFPDPVSGKPWFPAGVIVNKDLTKVMPVEQDKVTEYVDHSWYQYSKPATGKGLHPWEGESQKLYTGPTPPYKNLNVDRQYSWVKAPRYLDQPMEVGPLARLLVAYASGHKEVQGAVNGVLKQLNVGPEVLFSTLGRTAARGIDCLLIAQQTPKWLDQLIDNIGKGDTKVHNGAKWDPASWPQYAKGYGWHEAPRGALGHWIKIENGKILNYQAVVPSTWNASPRDAKGLRGPYEAALVGTPLADPNKPLEILRTIHSFDPCLACAVHVMDATGNEMVKINVR